MLKARFGPETSRSVRCINNRPRSLIFHLRSRCIIDMRTRKTRGLGLEWRLRVEESAHDP